MRALADADRIRAFLQRMGAAARAPVQLYLVGGATAVLHGWRPATIDIDLVFEPEVRELYEAIPRLKEDLDLNVEIASPAHFVPELPGWRDRSPYVGTFGTLTARHYDPTAQALAKLERGHAQDLTDLRHLVDDGLVVPDLLRELFAQVEAELVRYPAVDPPTLRARVDAFR